MKIIKSVVGVFAVLFSIQPLLSWAADKSHSKTQDEKGIQIAKPSKDGSTKDSGGSPTCGG